MNVYTFEDWLNPESQGMLRETDYNGSPIRNDSEQYKKLVDDGKMTYETLNKIQEAQAEAYQKIIDFTIEYLRAKHKRKSKQTPDLGGKLIEEIKRAKKTLKKNPEVYKDIIYPVTHRGIKKGAKFVTAYQYRKAVINGKPSIAFYQATNKIDDDSNHLDIPYSHEWIYCEMEVTLLWLKILEEELNNLDGSGTISSSSELPSKQMLLSDHLKEYSFFELEKVKNLSN